MQNSDLNKKFPEKKEYNLTFEKDFNRLIKAQYEGWNACHDAFMKVINSESGKDRCKTGVEKDAITPIGQEKCEHKYPIDTEHPQLIKYMTNEQKRICIKCGTSKPSPSISKEKEIEELAKLIANYCNKNSLLYAGVRNLSKLLVDKGYRKVGG